MHRPKFKAASALLAICAATNGCVITDGPYNQPSQEKLRIDYQAPQICTVQVASGPEFPVSADGRVVVGIPPLERESATYLLGVKVHEASPDAIDAIHVKKAGRTVRNLSLNNLKNLPLDDQGYRLVKIE